MEPPKKGTRILMSDRHPVKQQLQLLPSQGLRAIPNISQARIMPALARLSMTYLCEFCSI